MTSPSVPLTASLRSRASGAAHTIARRLHGAIASSQDVQSRDVGWADPSLACGYPSLLVLFDELAHIFPSEAWSTDVQTHLSLLARATRMSPVKHSGLYGGAAGVAWTLRRLAVCEPRLTSVVGNLDTEIIRTIHEQPQLSELGRQEDFHYDIISGRAGVLCYLLTITSRTAETQNSIDVLISDLIWLSDLSDDFPTRALIVSRGTARDNPLACAMPDGYFDMGLAHGLPGILAALALASVRGYGGTRAKHAVAAISAWIADRAVQDEWGPYWPLALPLGGKLDSVQHGRAGWCYGTAGISRALWLAGASLDNDELCHTAIVSFEAALRRLANTQTLDSPTLCHGTAGMIATAYAFLLDGVRIDGIEALVEKVLDACSPSHRFGIQDATAGGTTTDDPGFLTGAAGVALTLFAVSEGMRSDWLRPLAIR